LCYSHSPKIFFKQGTSSTQVSQLQKAQQTSESLSSLYAPTAFPTSFFSLKEIFSSLSDVVWMI
jgi:ubiquinone biosynthesis protein COQ9